MRDLSKVIWICEDRIEHKSQWEDMMLQWNCRENGQGKRQKTWADTLSTGFQYRGLGTEQSAKAQNKSMQLTPLNWKRIGCLHEMILKLQKPQDQAFDPK